MLLLETRRIDAGLSENLNVEGSGEVAALIANGSRSKDDQIFDRSPDNLHVEQHPDNFTFGQTVYLSAFYAAAREVPGIESLEVTKFQRQGANTNQYRAAGRMTFGRLEIPRLDNDPNHADRGVLRLVLFGGK